MFVSPAFAQAAGASGPSGFESMIPLLLIFVVFYFLLIRPQQKKQKDHKAQLDAIRRGDRVVTGGGIIGVVRKVIDDGELQVEIADGVRVRVRREMVSSILAKTEPVKETKETKGSKKTASAKTGEKADSNEDKAAAAEDEGAGEEQGDSSPKSLFGDKSK
ncbi:MAG: preprotein translocase subunit YajC [Rhodospirillales bacterium RIFCSPLOWO2_12_FULL_58_28]|nr:MAG: preprotein translocase subunit YajC [Rhodospirillales bacterium RIFCSPLOWO2_02_FULL_58_16]OHC76904.1 MAG: preprotein translocase subunit YajC [Rhodospirillales bacterium RIFCSPLOWO2_12_FULL_58_28]